MENDKGSNSLLQEGDIILIKEGMKVYADVPKSFVYDNRKGDFSICHEAIILNKQTDYLLGKYIVYKTVCDGGGMGQGINDIFPDGYHVFCVKVSNDTIKIDFYQTGFFTAMIKEIQPIGKAVQKWSIECYND